jgi:hypothetical protein
MCMRDGINEVRVHLLRDRHELKKQYPNEADVRASGQRGQSDL